MLIKVQDEHDTDTKWIRKHSPVSVSISSNIPGFCSPKCIIHENVEDLIKSMVNYLTKISNKAKTLVEDKLIDVFNQLDSKIQFWSNAAEGSTEIGAISEELKRRWSTPNVFTSLMNDIMGTRMSDSSRFIPVRYNSWEEIDEEEVKKIDISNCATKMRNALQKLRKDLRIYLAQLPVLGFNSSKYDLNLIKSHLANVLCLDATDSFVIKKNNQYQCLSTPDFRFLDVSNYLPPGTSYAQFLKTFKVEQEKGFFCYEYFDVLTKLDEQQLPPIDAFWSDLKKRNTLEDEKYCEYISNVHHFPQKDQDTILREMRIQFVPKSAEENYEFLKQIWKREKMTTLRDLLTWYNNLDVEPGVKAIVRLREFYWKEMTIDIFKDAISVPGIARRLLFDTAREDGYTFASFDYANRDLHEVIKANIVGGPSIIFNRYHKAEETYIRNNPTKTCKSCVGYDANALYLDCLSRELPVRNFVRWRRLENNSLLFKKDVSERYTIAFQWLDWISYKRKITILHKLNSGCEKYIGPYFVDGFNEETNTVFEFYGCYYHEHQHKNCTIYKNKKSKARYKRTLEREAFLKMLGYKVVSVWECVFKNECKSNVYLQNFLKQRDFKFSRKHNSFVNQSDLISGVIDNSFFGMVELDINVPNDLYNHFSEMSPLFVTCKIPYEYIGVHMQEHIKHGGSKYSEKTLLVGGMKARRILLATPLLKWYIQHGLEVTHVYQAVEFGRGNCFKKFTERVTKARRMGDTDVDKAILAEVMKLVGNSGYGGLLLQQENQQNCRYVRGISKARLRVNCPQFISLSELPSQNYEIISAKKRTTLDLPTQVGFFVLQYAKLRMLEFYYDFLNVYVHRSDFECLQMDTDSLYLALSASSLSDVILPEKKKAYIKMLKGYCNQDDIVSDNTTHFFPRTCCSLHSSHDKRTPGLFKLESEGVEMVSLNSKTYVLQIDIDNAKKVKLSSKGLNKSSVSNPLETYKNVLKDKLSRSVVNSGFQARKNAIYTYEQRRWGMTYFYCKREVQADGISTKPLNLELFPAKLIT